MQWRRSWNVSWLTMNSGQAETNLRGGGNSVEVLCVGEFEMM
jgi:hypothetical protein